MKTSWIQRISLLILVFTLGACDSSSLDDTTTPDSDLTPPTTDAVATIGPVSSLVTTDVINELNDIAASIDEYIEDASDTGGGSATENLIKMASGDSSSFETTITINHGTVNCDEGGSRLFFGTLDLISNGNEGGSADGTLTFQYSNCIDIALLETSNGLCAVTTTINGTITTTVDLTYGELDPFDDTDVNIEADSASSAPLDISIGSTASEQDYSFSHTIFASSTDDNLEGTVAMDDEVYDIVEIQDFIADTTASELCP